MQNTFFRRSFSRRIATPIFVTLVVASVICNRAEAGDSNDPTSSSDYALVGIARIDGVSYASLVEQQTGYHFLLSSDKQSAVDLALVSVFTDNDASGPSAMIQKDGASVLLKLEGDIASSSSVASAHAVQNRPLPDASSAGNLKPPPGATLPLVFQEVDPKKMTLTDEQKATLKQLRQEFIAALNGNSSGAANVATTGPSPNASTSPLANPNSATSAQQLQNWITAQEQSDEHFRMLYGTQAFVAYQESLAYPTPP